MTRFVESRQADDAKQLEAIKRQILSILERRQIRLTPSDLFKVLQGRPNSPQTRTIRLAVKQLVANGDIAYTNPYNTTHLELNVQKPIAVSDRIVLAPHNRRHSAHNPSKLTLKLDHGSAFGLGDHPTTRLCLQALDRVMHEFKAMNPHRKIFVLDIGTGTGVLAMAAVGLGAHQAVGIDIDPSALHEAQQNIELNRMGGKIRLTRASLASFENHGFNLVMANLRPPTLRLLLPQIPHVSASDAYWILSGFRSREASNVIAMLTAIEAKVEWQDQARNWAAIVAHWKNHSEGTSAGVIVGQATPLVSI
jgi:ribosomal protein L11 methyltransferase